VLQNWFDIEVGETLKLEDEEEEEEGDKEEEEEEEENYISSSIITGTNEQVKLNVCEVLNSHWTPWCQFCIIQGIMVKAVCYKPEGRWCDTR
jgi:hypothetical protein